MKVTNTIKLRINSCFESTRHLTQPKGRSPDETEALALKECKRGFIAHSKHFIYKVKLVRSPYLGLFMFPFINSNNIKDKQEKKVTHTYALRKAKIFKEARK